MFIPVLIIEDSRNMQTALRDLLLTIPGVVIVGTVGTEGDATDWIHHHKTEWELAVVDLILREGSGFHLLRRLKSANPEGHVLVFSEYATAALKDKCVALGADAVFLKSELPAMVRHVEQYCLAHSE